LIRFARLMDDLLFTPQRNGKLRLMVEYFRATPDPDRGWALAALTGSLSFAEVKPAAIRALVASRVDAELFGWSYDFVGDLAETAALIWPASSHDDHAPEPVEGEEAPSLGSIVATLIAARRGQAPELLAGWLDRLGPTARWALLKLVTGGLRIGVSARLAKTALALLGSQPIEDVEEVWHGQAAPYEPLFAWLDGKSDRPDAGTGPVFMPLMLANPLEDEDFAGLDPALYFAEWKWDGIRVQLACRGGERRIWSRGADDVSPAFPDVIEALPDDIVLDGELLVGEAGGAVRPFNDLQQRLNRKVPAAAMIAQYPAFVRLYDALYIAGADLRPLPLEARRRHLEEWYRTESRPRLDLSPLIPFTDWAELGRLRDGAREAGIEGLMIKRRDSIYVSGRPKGPWFKWKRGALTLDCVLMYDQRGHGKRSSFYSDYTFGAWRADGTLVPVGKAYSGFTDEELLLLDRWVRHHTTKRYGPVREVEPGLVLEVAFDSVHRSTRHKSGLAMRFPRIHRIRWDKPFAEADTVETLAAMM
jgi:DNA ligase-1